MGQGWQSHDLAGLTFPGSGDEIYYQPGPNQMEVFVPSGAPNQWRGTHYVRSVIVKSGSEYIMTLPDGSRKTFAVDGRITAITGAGGQALTVQYSGTQLTSVNGSGGGQSVEFGYEYSGGRVSFITQRLNGAEVRRQAFTYWSSGLLRQVETQEKRGQAWLETHAVFYRYYDGNTGLLQFILDDDALHRMASAGLDPATAPDLQVVEYAGTAFSYDSNSRLFTLATQGGALAWELDYEITGYGGGSPNECTNRTVIKHPDSSVETIFFNRSGGVLLRRVEAVNPVTNAPETFYPVCQQFDEKGRIIQDISAAAIASVNPTSATLITLHTDAGLIRGFSYADNQGGGYADEWVQQGSSGTPVLQRRRTYVQHAVAGAPSIWVPATLTAFLNETGTETAVTSFAYTWLTSYQMATRTTTEPVVSTAQNGTGLTYTIVETFDANGFLTGRTDQTGMHTAFVYDPATGGLKQKAVDTAGLNLITDYVLDYQGRTVLEKGPVHPVDLAGMVTNVRTAQWTYYRDPEEQRISFPGYVIPGATAEHDTFHCVGPVTVEHGFVLPDSPDGTSFSATTVSPWELVRLPQPDDAWPQSAWVRWQSRHFSKGGRLLAERLYHQIPDSGEGAKDTDYALTSYAYDTGGRVDRVTTPGGTIRQQKFNAMGWVLEELTGTAAGNMQITAKNQYDAHSVLQGDGLLTQVTVIVDGTAGNDRVTTLTYDWRQRQETASVSVVLAGSSTPVTLLTQNTWDNRSLVTAVKQYHTSVAPAHLQDYSATNFDTLGRPWQTIRYEVNPTTGAVGNNLVSNTWYDPSGRVLVQWPAGSQAFQSLVYDAVGRVTTAYTAYQPGWSSGMPVIASSIVMEEQFTDYDDAGNVCYTRRKQRYDNATGNGPLKDHGAAQPQARVSCAASYPDALGRTMATADFGTNGLSTTPWHRPDLIPACTDDVLVTLTAYNPKGEPFQTTDPMQAVTTRTWDAAGRLIEELAGRVPGRTLPAIDRKTAYEYNADGNLTKLIARNNTASGMEYQETLWTYGVTIAGGSALHSNLLVATKTYPDSTGGSDVVTYTYNLASQVTSMKDQAGLVHTYTYDTLGRQTADAVTAWGSSTVDQTVKKLTTGYDARGLVVAAGSEDAAGDLVNAVYFAHNGWRQLSTEAQVQDIPGTGGVTRTIQYGYAPGSAGSNTIRRTSITYPSGQTSAPVLNYHYGSTGTDHGNALSRVSALRDGSTDIISYTWLGLSNPVDVNYNVPATHLTFGTAANHYDGLDRFGRPITVQWLKGTDALVKAQYRYDRSSNRQWRYDAAAHAAGVATEDQWYEYDGLYQVREFQRGTLAGTYPNFSGITPVGQNQAWNYDAMGNWLGYTNDALNQTRQFNKVNEITSIAGPSGVVTPLYDPTGNMTTMPAVDNWTTAQTLKWDAWNRLVKVSEGSTPIASYTYDALFRRVSKTTGTSRRLFYYSDDWQILEEYVGTASDPQMRYWYGIRDINDIARRQFFGSTDTDLYALRETMNVVALADASGAVQQRMAYDAFGNTRFLNGTTWGSGSNSSDWAMLFHAHYRDSETGLYQMRFRYYHPRLGVWLSRDPLEEWGSANLYEIVENNGIGVSDFLGLQCGPAGYAMDGHSGRFFRQMSGGSGDPEGDALHGSGTTGRDFLNHLASLTKHCCCIKDLRIASHGGGNGFGDLGPTSALYRNGFYGEFRDGYPRPQQAPGMGANHPSLGGRDVADLKSMMDRGEIQFCPDCVIKIHACGQSARFLETLGQATGCRVIGGSGGCSADPRDRDGKGNDSRRSRWRNDKGWLQSNAGAPAVRLPVGKTFNPNSI
jgi:RHS repeat-associated protein